MKYDSTGPGTIIIVENGNVSLDTEFMKSVDCQVCVVIYHTRAGPRNGRRL